jgi:hypothetical protein
MKKVFALMVLVAAIFTACENQGNENDTRNDFTLVRTSESVMDFTAEGGDGEITYTLESTRVTAKPTVTATVAVDWITNIVSTDDNRITFTVLPNEGDARSELMTVSCGDQNFKVMIQQASPGAIDVRFTATHLGGAYFGNFVKDGGGASDYNYFVILSDKQARMYNSPAYGAIEYRFDIYSDVCGEFNTKQGVPLGVYTIDHRSTCVAGTIDGRSNCSYICDDSGDTLVTRSFTEATLTVTEDGIFADVTLTTGEVHRVEYHGAPVFEKFSEPSYADISPISNHTSDIEFDIKGGDIMAYYRGDWFSSDDDVWFVHMIETKLPSYSGVYLIMNLIVPKSLGGYSNPIGFYGEYTLTDPTAESWDYTFPAGRLREDSTQLNAWYMHFGTEFVDMVPIKGGTIKVEGDDSVNCTITVDGIDDNGNRVIGTFSGVISDRQNQFGK